MRILSNSSVNINMNQSESGSTVFGVKQSGDKNRSNVFFAGNNNDNDQAFDLKKQKARKDAMKIVMDAYDGDKMVDDQIDSMKDRVDEIYGEISQYADQVDKLNQNKEDLKKSYNLTDEMIENGDVPEQYKKDVKSIDEDLEEWNRRIENGKNEAFGRNEAVEGIKVEACKQHNMFDATRQAEDIMDEARQDIINTVKQQAVDKIDENIQDKVEEGKEKAEAKKEKEEKIDKKEEKEEKNDELQEDARDIIDADTKANVDKGIDDIKQKMQMLEEDIKGITVDTQL